jgi:hypothetical protein
LPSDELKVCLNSLITYLDLFRQKYLLYDKR